MAIDRRKQIVEAAEKSFAMFGYKATTMEQVAKIANVGKGTIYTFFATKEELFDHIMQSLIMGMLNAAERSIDPSRPFFNNLQMALYGVIDYRKQHDLALKLSQEADEMGTAAAQAALKKVEGAVTAFVKRVVEKALADGEIKTCDPEITAYVIYKLFVALVVDWERSHQPLDKDRIAGLFQLYLGEGLAL